MVAGAGGCSWKRQNLKTWPGGYALELGESQGGSAALDQRCGSEQEGLGTVCMSLLGFRRYLKLHTLGAGETALLLRALSALAADGACFPVPT